MVTKKNGCSKTKQTKKKRFTKDYCTLSYLIRKYEEAAEGVADKALLIRIQNGPSTDSQHLETESSTDKTSLGITTDSVGKELGEVTSSGVLLVSVASHRTYVY